MSLRFGGGLSAGAKVRQKKATFCIRRNDGSDEEDQRICAAEEEAAAAADEADRRSRSLSLSGSTLLLTEFVPKHEDEEKGITLENGKAAKVGGTPVLVDPVEDAIRSLEAFGWFFVQYFLNIFLFQFFNIFLLSNQKIKQNQN